MDDDTPDVEALDLVQLDPEGEVAPCFRGCFAVVTEPKPWGFQGYVTVVGNLKSDLPGQAYVRVKKGGYVKVGRAEWTVE